MIYGKTISSERLPGHAANSWLVLLDKWIALAELGIPQERAAVTLKAAKDALLKAMPESKASAMPMAALLEAAVLGSRASGQKALRGLLSEGKIQRTGKGSKNAAFRYFRACLG